MASTQFLDLTNKLLRRLNEVEIAQADFPGVRGVQALAKDAINASLAEINNQFFEWPFNATSGTQLLAVGTNFYAFPSDLKNIDWNSFHIQKNTLLGINDTHLDFISKDQWEEGYKDKDLDAGVTGVNIPLFVFRGQGFGFGVTPSPNQAFTVQFDYFKLYTELSAYNDQPTVPTNFNEVIIQGALYHFYMFRDNDTQSQAAMSKFSKVLRDMTNILGNPDDRMQSTLIVHESWASMPTFSGASGS